MNLLSTEIEAFTAQCDALAALIGSLDEPAWSAATQFKGWSITDILTHLHSGNLSAVLSLQDAAAFERFMAERALAAARLPPGSGNLPLQYEHVGHLRHLALFEAWRRGARQLADAFATADPRQRVPWGGKQMSARSSISARLMEHWAHAQAIHDMLGSQRVDTDHLIHVATLCVNTFEWSFAVRKAPVPAARPAVRLISPSGQHWQWPATGASADTIEGQAVEFCQVNAQTRNIADTTLLVKGPVATEWMRFAQCFAGVARTPPAAGTRFARRPSASA